MKNFKRIIPIFVAMEEEITPYLPFLNLEKDWENNGLIKTSLYSYKDVLFYVAVTGIGKVNAAATTAFSLSCIQKEYGKLESIAINIGIVGGLNQELKSNDVVVVEQFCQHDIDVTPLGYKMGQIPGHEKVYIPAKVPNLANLDKTLVTCSSSDAFITDPNIPLKADIVDMESGAIAQVLDYFDIKLISIKIISDVIGAKKDNAQEYKFNKFTAVGKAKAYFETLIKEIGEN